MLIPGNSNSQAIKQTVKDHGHNFPRKCRRLIGRCTRHQVNGAFILVPRTPIRIPIMGGKMPPPTSNMTIDSKIRNRPPFFL